MEENTTNLNDKLLELLNDKGILAFYLMSLLSRRTNLKYTSLFRLKIDRNSISIK